MLQKKFFSALMLGVLVLPMGAFAQTATTAPAKTVYTAPKTDIDKIRDEGLNRSQVMETLSYLVDVIGPRLTNSPGMKRANEWTRDTMTKWGLKNAKLESWGPFGRGWTLKQFSASVHSPEYFPVIAYPKAWSPSTKGAVTGDVVLFDAKTEEDLAKYKGKLRGKIVLMSPVRELKAEFEPLASRYTDEELAKMAAFDPTASAGPGNRQQRQMDDFFKSFQLQAKRANFRSKKGLQF